MITNISWPISNKMTTYKDKKDVIVEKIKSFANDGVREHRITMGTHTGTHIDAPAHFLKDGATLNELSLDALVGQCRVLDMTHISTKITLDDLERCSINSGERILFKTKNSFLDPTQPFTPDFVYLDASGAQYLADAGVACVGIDYLGIERSQSAHESHKALLEKNILIIEGLRLAHIEPGSYKLICLPLNLPGCEAAPARAVLVKNP